MCASSQVVLLGMRPGPRWWQACVRDGQGLQLLGPLPGWVSWALLAFCHGPLPCDVHGWALPLTYLECLLGTQPFQSTCLWEKGLAEGWSQTFIPC